MTDSTKTVVNRFVSDKEWMDIAFKHFIQHAQQRVQHFNFFIIFSSILTSGTITTIQPSVHAYYLGAGLGLIQIFISFIFLKLEGRNRFLIKHAENVIKTIEKDYENSQTHCHLLFTTEEVESLKQEEANKNKFYFFRPFSHRQSYKFIYYVFGVLGLTSLTLSFYFLFNGTEVKVQASKTVQLKVIKTSDSLNHLGKDTLFISGEIKDEN